MRENRLKTYFLTFLFCVSVSSLAQENRSYDGSGNNLSDPDIGKVNAQIRRITEIAYGGNGFSDPGGLERPNPRAVSNLLFDQEEFIADINNLSDFVWGYGQFIDHDISFNLDTLEDFMAIDIPTGDPFFDPHNSGNQVIMMRRGSFDPQTGTGMNNPRQQTNSITSWVDGSGVYGSDQQTANWLRTGVGGKMKVSQGNLLPFNTTTGELDDPIDTNAPWMAIEGHPPVEKYFVAGDIRANEQPGLIAFHTLFIREHNRLCDEVKEENPTWTDEQLFQRARKMVGALIQVILYEEWLPALGIELADYQGYNDSLDPTVTSIFTAAAFRLGHTMVNEQLIRLEETGDTLSFGSIHIKEAFFDPFVVSEEGGIDPYFRGMATQSQQKFDNKVVSTLRNFLFGPPGSGGLDLVALNIQRGRERGIPGYNEVRRSMGLEEYIDFAQISADPQTQNQLSELYGDVEEIDPWVGMLSEDPASPSIAGELVTVILRSQFEELRDGDRFWYENDPAFTPEEVAMLKSTTLSQIIKRNTSIVRIQDDVFHARNPYVIVGITPFESIRRLEIKAYPNPLAEYLNLYIKTLRQEEANLQIFDGVGRVVFQQDLLLRVGENNYQFELGDRIRNGVYVVSLQSKQGRGSLRIIKE